MLQTTLYLIFGLLLCLYFYYKKLFTYWKRRNVVHLQPSIPFGNFNYKITSKTMETIKDIYLQLKETKQKYCGYYLLGAPVFMPLDPELCKMLMVNDFQHFHDHGFYYDEEVDPMTANLVTLPGSQWRILRNKFSTTFSTVKMKMIFPLVQQSADRIENVLKKVMETKHFIDAHDMTSRYTIDVICSTIFGFDSNCLENRSEEVIKIGHMYMKTNLIGSLKLAIGVMAPNVLHFFKLSFLNKTMTQYFYDVIASNVEYRTRNKIDKPDLMDQLMQLMKSTNEEQGLTIRQIASQAFLFYIAGFETSSNTISYCLFELAQNQNIQEKTRNEILTILKKYNGQLTYEALADMTYVEMVINETLRKYPPASMLNRVCTREYKVPDSDLVIEEGTRVVISTLGMHNDPEYYPEPEQFRPERFTEQEKAKRHPFTFLPFGQGPRICLGLKLAMMEVKLSLVAFLKDYRYVIHDKMILPLETYSNGNLLVPKTRIMLQPIKIN